MSLVPINTRVQNGRPRRSGAAQNHRADMFPAPNRGIDVTQQLVGADPLTAIRLENLIPRVYGCELRHGYKRWVSNLGGEVRSLMPYIAADGSAQMFAATDAGTIFDVSAALPSGDVPVPVLTAPATPTGVNGQWYWVNFTNDGGDFLLMVCAGAGYYSWNGTAWTQHVEGTAPGQIDGIDPALFDYIWVWKRRIWFLQKNSTKAWYLPVDQIAGKVTAFDFGSMLLHGGSLAVGSNWTVDAGNGIDDKLVIISDQGDILIYGGIDPDEATTFQNEGRWYIGRVPYGRRFVTRYSSDLAMVCERGLAFLTEILRGQGFFANADTAQRVNSAIALEVQESLNESYWELRFVLPQQLLLVNTPTSLVQDRQWAFEVNNKAFANLVDIPMHTVEVLGANIFSGDINGNIWLLFSGDSDGAVDDVPGKDINGTVVTAFQPFGEGYRTKRFLMVRPSFIAPAPPSVKVAINPDWRFGAPSGAPIYTRAGQSLWDTAVWSQSVWSGDTQSYAAWVGAQGLGFYGALAMQVRGQPGTIFASWQAITTPGGVL